jgi:gas vesicle protein
MKSAIIVIGGAVAAVAALVVAMGPELRRYLKMRSM